MSFMDFGPSDATQMTDTFLAVDETLRSVQSHVTVLTTQALAQAKKRERTRIYRHAVEVESAVQQARNEIARALTALAQYQHLGGTSPEA